MRNRLLVLLLLLPGALFFVIPSVGSSVFLSPDETANAVSARTFAWQRNMRYEEPLLEQFPWLHPRSFVTQGTAMVPVGFLGLPILLGIIWKLVGEWGLVLFTPLLALSVAFPLWRFTSKWGRTSQAATVLTWLSFPTVILYANRGLFANLPVVCLTVWACYFLWDERVVRRASSVALAGLCAGFAIAMRPTEIVWVLPWLWLAMRPLSLRRREVSEVLMFGFALSFPLFLAAFVAWRTYGSPDAVGYFLRDPVVIAPGYQLPPASHVSIWPFGIHPMNVLRNVWFYLVKTLWPWVVPLVAIAMLFWKKRTARPYLIAGAWTTFALVLIYGQAVYQDHVGVNFVSFGNSFLRYLLPIAPLAALAVGALATKLPKRFSVAIVALLVLLGTNMALRGDSESVLPSRQELQRYQAIRNAAVEKLGTETIILSERSDKIFFPTFRVASPLPEKSELKRLRCGYPALFAETLNQQEFSRWEDAGFSFMSVVENKNQTLYQDKNNCGAGSQTP